MTTFTDDGIVLRRVNYAEADRVLTVLTREHGKLGVIARGVRKAGSRLAPHTDLFAQSRIQLATGRGQLRTLTQAQLSGPPPRLDDVRRSTCAALCAEVADRVLEADHPLDEGIFELVVSAIAGCADPLRDPRTAVAWFVRRMVDRLGYAPELQVCANCATPLPESPAVFSAVAGGLLCGSCAPHDLGAVPCSVRAIKVLRVIAADQADVYRRLRLDPDTVAVLEEIAEHELAQHLDRRLRSLDVLRSLGPAPASRVPATVPWDPAPAGPAAAVREQPAPG